MSSFTINAIELYEKLCDLVTEHQKFSEKTFGPDNERGPIGPLKHLEKEAKEAYENPDNWEEYADCFLLLLDAVRRSGHKFNQLVEAAYKKLQINKNREWPEYPKWTYYYEETVASVLPVENPHKVTAVHKDITLTAEGKTKEEAYANIYKQVRKTNETPLEHIK
jgi:hypothetical protein